MGLTAERQGGRLADEIQVDFWTWLRSLTVLIMIFFYTSWPIMVLWIVLMLGSRAIYVVPTKQLSMMILCLLGVLLKLLYHKDQYWGPYCFLFFVNDLPNVVTHAQINMYADDTELHCCGEDLRNIQCDLQLDLCKVQDWLQLNVSKSVITV